MNKTTVCGIAFRFESEYGNITIAMDEINDKPTVYVVRKDGFHHGYEDLNKAIAQGFVLERKGNEEQIKLTDAEKDFLVQFHPVFEKLQETDAVELAAFISKL